MKKSLILVILVFCCSIVFAQNELLVQSGNKGPYLSHTVVAKENFYSVGRLYNVSAKEIAAFNGLDMTRGLEIGQELKIPLTTNNYNQLKENGRPVYYTVQQKEGLYRVSLKNHNVLMANIRKWNHLTSDKIGTGQKLIVGYLVSPEANNIVAETTAVTEQKVVKIEEAPKKTEEEQPKKTEEPKKQEERKDAEIKTDVAVKKEQEEPVQKTEERIKTTPVADKKSIQTASQVAVLDGSGGYFRSQFDLQIRTQPVKVDETASAGIFKTASGWQDAKYYALMDHVEPGTIIRIINPTNNRAIYAKVLGEMSGIRQNQGYDVRISNAAASALDVSDMDKFIVKVNY
ncbi:MAG: LysM peptidoglycan-binding domain-containing protein [Flavisolibacter sp.]